MALEKEATEIQEGAEKLRKDTKALRKRADDLKLREAMLAAEEEEERVRAGGEGSSGVKIMFNI
jgi:hypothetical protein